MNRRRVTSNVTKRSHAFNRSNLEGVHIVVTKCEIVVNSHTVAYTHVYHHFVHLSPTSPCETPRSKRLPAKIPLTLHLKHQAVLPYYHVSPYPVLSCLITKAIPTAAQHPCSRACARSQKSGSRWSLGVANALTCISQECTCVEKRDMDADFR